MSSKTNQTPEERTEYWRGRMIDQLKSTSAQCGIDFEKILNDARHVTLETDGIVKAMKMSSSSLQMLLEAIEAAKPLVQGGGDQT